MFCACSRCNARSKWLTVAHYSLYAHTPIIDLQKQSKKPCNIQLTNLKRSVFMGKCQTSTLHVRLPSRLISSYKCKNSEDLCLISQVSLWLPQLIFQWVLLVFSVTPFKIDRNKNQNCSVDKSRVWEKKEGQYAKPLAKIHQVTVIFLKQNMRRNVLPKLIEICVKTPCWSPSGWAPHGSRKLTETSATEFCFRNKNLSLEEIKDIKIILFLIHELFR